MSIGPTLSAAARSRTVKLSGSSTGGLGGGGGGGGATVAGLSGSDPAGRAVGIPGRTSGLAGAAPGLAMGAPCLGAAGRAPGAPGLACGAPGFAPGVIGRESGLCCGALCARGWVGLVGVLGFVVTDAGGASVNLGGPARSECVGFAGTDGLCAGAAVVFVSVGFGLFDSSRLFAGFTSGIAHSPFQSQPRARQGAGRRKDVAR